MTGRSPPADHGDAVLEPQATVGTPATDEPCSSSTPPQIERDRSPDAVEGLDLDAMEKAIRAAIEEGVWAKNEVLDGVRCIVYSGIDETADAILQLPAVLRLIATIREMESRAAAAERGLRLYEDDDVRAAVLLEQEGLLMAAEARAEAAEASNRELLEALTTAVRFEEQFIDSKKRHPWLAKARTAISHALSRSEGSRDE